LPRDFGPERRGNLPLAGNREADDPALRSRSSRRRRRGPSR
jgi:hypothetical protein